MKVIFHWESYYYAGFTSKDEFLNLSQQVPTPSLRNLDKYSSCVLWKPPYIGHRRLVWMWHFQETKYAIGISKRNYQEIPGKSYYMLWTLRSRLWWTSRTIERYSESSSLRDKILVESSSFTTIVGLCQMLPIYLL